MASGIICGVSSALLKKQKSFIIMLRRDALCCLAVSALKKTRCYFFDTSPPSTSHLTHSVGFFTDTGSDEPEYGDGRPFNNKFFDNEVLDTDVGVKLKHSDRISIECEDRSCCVMEHCFREIDR